MVQICSSTLERHTHTITKYYCWLYPKRKIRMEAVHLKGTVTTLFAFSEQGEIVLTATQFIRGPWLGTCLYLPAMKKTGNYDDILCFPELVEHGFQSAGGFGRITIPTSGKLYKMLVNLHLFVKSQPVYIRRGLTRQLKENFHTRPSLLTL